MSERHNLPASVQELVDLIGLQKAMKLVRSLGGTTFPVPKRQTKLGELRYNMLADVVGVEEADTLVAYFGGGELYIPRCAKALQERRDAEIRRLFTQECRAGTSSTGIVNALAQKYKLTDRRVWSILKEAPSNEEWLMLL